MKAGLPQKPPSKGKKPAPASDPTNSAPQPPALAPRVIPLHGTLSTLNCTLCHLTTPLLPYLPLPPTTIPCPTCHLSSTIRQALSERQRRSGNLRPSVVLYGEEHGQGDLIGAVVERDIRGTGGKLKEGKIDFLLVAGTSLAIPGVKRMIKEMAKAVHSGKRTAPSSRANKRRIKSVFVNNEPPKNPGEWAGVFDLWVQADIQEFATTVDTALSPVAGDEAGINRPIKTETPSTPKKNKAKGGMPPTPVSLHKHSAAAAMVAHAVPEAVTPQHKVKIAENGWLPTPRATPPSPSRKRKADRGEQHTPTKKHCGNLSLASDRSVPTRAEAA